MTTLIAVYTSDGCAGRCDASCHDAKHDECTCICAGRNHGVGRQRAIENTRELAEKWLERYCAERGIDLREAHAVFGESVVQGELPF
jgi:hypothetical protein